MDNISLSDASDSEVCARIAYQLILRAARHYPAGQPARPEVLQSLCRRLDAKHLSTLSLWVHAYLRGLNAGELIEFSRTAFLFRARLGLDFRRVAFIEYKAHRRCDPRVTNRGVTARATKRGRDAAS